MTFFPLTTRLHKYVYLLLRKRQTVTPTLNIDGQTITENGRVEEEKKGSHLGSQAITQTHFKMLRSICITFEIVTNRVTREREKARERAKKDDKKGIVEIPKK